MNRGLFLSVFGDQLGLWWYNGGLNTNCVTSPSLSSTFISQRRGLGLQFPKG